MHSLLIQNLQDYSSADKWENIYGAAGLDSTNVTLPAGQTIVLHGCAQPGNSVNVENIIVPAGATVSTTPPGQALGGGQAS
jgi:hypothetical protein